VPEPPAGPNFFGLLHISVATGSVFTAEKRQETVNRRGISGLGAQLLAGLQPETRRSGSQRVSESATRNFVNRLISWATTATVLGAWATSSTGVAAFGLRLDLPELLGNHATVPQEASACGTVSSPLCSLTRPEVP